MTYRLPPHTCLPQELMDGGSLHSALNLNSRLSGERVFSWYNRGRAVCLEVARGIHYLHSFKVTHFDIKSVSSPGTWEGSAWTAGKVAWLACLPAQCVAIVYLWPLTYSAQYVK